MASAGLRQHSGGKVNIAPRGSAGWRWHLPVSAVTMEHGCSRTEPLWIQGHACKLILCQKNGQCRWKHFGQNIACDMSNCVNDTEAVATCRENIKRVNFLFLWGRLLQHALASPAKYPFQYCQSALLKLLLCPFAASVSR